MSCASLQCQNEKIQSRKLLDKQKKNALNCLALDTIFERQFREYVGEVRRHKKMTLGIMEGRFQQNCLNNEEDPDVTENMQAKEVEQYLGLKSKVTQVFNEILRTCASISNATSSELELGNLNPEEILDPIDFDPDQDTDQCMFCLNKELIAEREMANHMSYLKDVKTQRSTSLTHIDERASSTQFDLPAVSSGLFSSNALEDAVKSLQTSACSSSLDTTSVSNAFSQQVHHNPFGSIPPNSDAATAALLSFPMLTEALAASLLEMGMQQQHQQQQIQSANAFNDFAMMFPFYSMPGLSDMPKNLSKNMVTDFFDAALALQNGNHTLDQVMGSNVVHQEMPMETEESQILDASTSSGVKTENNAVLDVTKTDSDDEKLTGGAGLEDGNAANKRTYSSGDLQQALRDVCDGKMGTRRASLTYGVPRSTIRNHLNKIKAYGKDIAFRMIDSENDCSDTIGDLLTLRGKQMISELRYVEEAKTVPKSSEGTTVFPLMDKSQNLSDRFVRHSLANHLEDYLSRESLNNDLLGQSNEDRSHTPILPEKVNNVYLSEMDMQYYPNLKCALTAVHSCGMSVSKASAIFNIHTSNIRDALTLYMLTN